ncbi:MAG: c-type cytochrome [Pseudomonadales bacterium]|nr:c-type cytochrome [Pseudomonadales bacterium]
MPERNLPLLLSLLWTLWIPAALACTPDTHEPLVPLTESPRQDPALVSLGRDLFHDVRLSADNSISCATCHPIDRGGADQLALSVGIKGQFGTRNTPTVLNAALNYRQFWDGRSATLEDQAMQPVTTPHEMGSDWPEVFAKLQQDPDLVARFRTAFPGTPTLTQDNLTKALASYERSLIIGNSPFDRYLCGQTDAISPAARSGYQLFKDIGCSACHQGQNVGGNMFEKVGIVIPAEGSIFEDDDPGRFAQTGNPEDRFEFRVPPLRNVALTPPYFHNGKVGSLKDAVQLMAHHQLGRDLSETQLSDIVEFLNTLTSVEPQ